MTCKRCGEFVQPGDKYCGVCGAEVSSATGDDASAQGKVEPSYAPREARNPRSSRRVLILSAVGALLVLLLTAAGAVALTGIVPTARLLGEEEGSSSTESVDASQPSSEPTTTTASVSPDSPPDPAFEKLLPTLVQKTRVPIMLPADLPEELKNVAIDGGFRGNGYGISFLRNPSDNVVERPPIEVLGYLQTLPKSETKSSGYFEAASVETVTLPDGTEATLRQMRPIANKGSEDQFWEGKFDKGGATYTLTIVSEEIPKVAIKQVLSTMVSVSQGDPSGGERTTPDIPRDAPRAKESPTPEEREQDVPKARPNPPPRPVQTQPWPAPLQGSDPYTYCKQNPQMCPTLSPEERVWKEKALYPWK